jgi:hypothetical protein
MAHAHARSFDDLSPEDAVQEINQERKRKSMIALGLGGLAVVVFGAFVFLAYNDVPAPESPANANPRVVQPQQQQAQPQP